MKQGITTVMTRPLDDCTYSARSLIADLGIWKKLKDCSLHYTVHSFVRQFILKCSLDSFRIPPTVWLKFEREIFRPLICELGVVEFGDGPWFLLVPHWHILPI